MLFCKTSLCEAAGILFHVIRVVTPPEETCGSGVCVCWPFLSTSPGSGHSHEVSAPILLELSELEAFLQQQPTREQHSSG